MVFAFECFADEDVWHILTFECGLPPKKLHSESKGRVVADTLKEGNAHLGLVDEEPCTAPPESLRRATRVERTDDVEVRKIKDRHILILRPRLEECFLAGMRRVGLESQLASEAGELHRFLGTQNIRRHEQFREELTLLLRVSRRRRIRVFISVLEDLVRKVMTEQARDNNRL